MNYIIRDKVKSDCFAVHHVTVISCLDGNPSNNFYLHIGGVKIKTRIFEKLNLPENVYLFNI